MVFEITQLADGEVVLRQADADGEPLVRIRFSSEVKDMLGDDAVVVAEAMIDAAAAFLEADPDDQDLSSPPPIVH